MKRDTGQDAKFQRADDVVVYKSYGRDKRFVHCYNFFMYSLSCLCCFDLELGFVMLHVEHVKNV